VTRTIFKASASDTYAASYGVTACRNCHTRCNNGRCDERRNGTSTKSETASEARRAVISPPTTWRRNTDMTSRSMRSGAARVSSANRCRARRPSCPSSPRATAKTLASTTITFRPNVTGSRIK
jgi:hypothetical protein